MNDEQTTPQNSPELSEETSPDSNTVQSYEQEAAQEAVRDAVQDATQEAEPMQPVQPTEPLQEVPVQEADAAPTVQEVDAVQTTQQIETAPATPETVQQTLEQTSYGQQTAQQPAAAPQVYEQQTYDGQTYVQQAYSPQGYGQQTAAQTEQQATGQVGYAPTGQPAAEQPAAGQQAAGQPWPQGYGQTTQAGYQAQTPPGYPSVEQIPFSPPIQPQKKKVWPWILGGCLLVLVLFIGGCAGCVACSAMVGTIADVTDNGSTSSDSLYDYGYDYDYDSSSSYTYTLDDLNSLLIYNDAENTVSDGKCAPGIYAVGDTISAGTYFLEGSPTYQSYCYVFEKADDGNYEYKTSLVYFGNYFLTLDDDAVLVFDPYNKESRAYPVAQANFTPEQPYTCATYRVGTDIPAGTYTISVADEASANASQTAAAYVMDDVEFDEDSVVDAVYVSSTYTATVSVYDGQYLELYASVATPSNTVSYTPQDELLHAA